MTRRAGQPPWLIFLVAIAVVFGGYYLWLGVQAYLRTGGLGVIEATQQAQVQATATADRVVLNVGPTLRPTFTPIPECKLFVVSVPSAIVRDQPNTAGQIIDSWDMGTRVCMIDRAPEDREWYIIDRDPQTRRIEFAYMHETVIVAQNPTATPTRTPTPLSTVTPLPSDTPTPTPEVIPTDTPNRNATRTPTPTVTPTYTPTPTPTIGFQNV